MPIPALKDSKMAPTTYPRDPSFKKNGVAHQNWTHVSPQIHGPHICLRSENKCALFFFKSFKSVLSPSKFSAGSCKSPKRSKSSSLWPTKPKRESKSYWCCSFLRHSVNVPWHPCATPSFNCWQTSHLVSAKRTAKYNSTLIRFANVARSSTSVYALGAQETVKMRNSDFQLMQMMYPWWNKMPVPVFIDASTCPFIKQTAMRY